MKITKQLVKSLICLVCIFSVMSFVITPKSLADDCGRSDRVAVPACLDIKAGSNAWEYNNNCSHPVTLKFDQSGSDRRPTIEKGGRGYLFFSVHKQDAKISCCPRYNSCSNS